MRLTDLDPKWLHYKSGHRCGIIFRNPNKPGWYVTCFNAPTPRASQIEAVELILGPWEQVHNVALCNESAGWTFSNLDNFETLSIVKSIDGPFWHGSVTNGEIQGGLNPA